jgi:tetratricopeptide (TPR) repeat protein
MSAGRYFRNILVVCVGVLPAAADRASAQVAIVGSSSTFVSPGFTVGTLGSWGGGPWGGGYRGFSIGYSGGNYGTSYYSSGVYSPGYGSSYYGGGYWPGWSGGYWGNGSWGDGYWGGGVPYWSGYGGFALPPLVVPAETFYGPSAVRRFMGIDPPLGTPIVNNTIVNLPSQAQGFGVLAPGQQPARPVGVRASNAAARDLAKRQIAAGDNLFGKQQYAQALDAYKQAAKAAPDLADSHFRQMAALVALGRYEAAVDTVKAGMRISKDTINGQFRVSALYGDNLIARTAHLDALAKLTAERRSSDLFFLAGVMLFFDNPPQRSAPFFEQASQLAVVERWHIDVYREVLKQLAAAAAQANAGDAAPAGGAVPGGNAPAAQGADAPAAREAKAPAAPVKRGVMRPAADDPAAGREI